MKELIKTHDLQLLATELARCDASLEDEIRPLCQALSEFYLNTRYPGFDLEDPDWPVFRAQFDAITALAAKNPRPRFATRAVNLRRLLLRKPVLLCSCSRWGRGAGFGKARLAP